MADEAAVVSPTGQAAGQFDLQPVSSRVCAAHQDWNIFHRDFYLSVARVGTGIDQGIVEGSAFGVAYGDLETALDCGADLVPGVEQDVKLGNGRTSQHDLTLSYDPWIR